MLGKLGTDDGGGVSQRGDICFSLLNTRDLILRPLLFQLGLNARGKQFLFLVRQGHGVVFKTTLERTKEQKQVNYREIHIINLLRVKLVSLHGCPENVAAFSRTESPHSKRTIPLPQRNTQSRWLPSPRPLAALPPQGQSPLCRHVRAHADGSQDSCHAVRWTF